MDIAKTILEQLGGSRFVIMTGAKNFVSGGKDLSFKIGRNDKGVTHVRIVLNSKDLYDVEYLKVRGIKREVLSEENDLFFDNLQSSFTRNTGLDTHL